jgi:hypothetical protein
VPCKYLSYEAEEIQAYININPELTGCLITNGELEVQ